MTYKTVYRNSIDNPEAFWAEAASALEWDKPWDKVLDSSVAPYYEWFSGAEINTCRDFLADELAAMRDDSVIIALGSIAHKSVVAGLGLKQKDHVFTHAGEFALPRGMTLIDSYHCSRYNTQTRRLTADMFSDIFHLASKRLARQ